jgi:hypothetical protein
MRLEFSGNWNPFDVARFFVAVSIQRPIIGLGVPTAFDLVIVNFVSPAQHSLRR